MNTLLYELKSLTTIFENENCVILSLQWWLSGGVLEEWTFWNLECEKDYRNDESGPILGNYILKKILKKNSQIYEFLGILSFKIFKDFKNSLKIPFHKRIS